METFPLLLPASEVFLISFNSVQYRILYSDIFRYLPIPMLIPDAFRCLGLGQRNALCEFDCIWFLQVAPCKCGCGLFPLNYLLSTLLHWVTRLGLGTAVYVLCILLFGCMECSRCLKVQTSFLLILFACVLICFAGLLCFYLLSVFLILSSVLYIFLYLT